MSENDSGRDADPGRARGVPPLFAGGERQSVRGWIVFGAVSVFLMPVAVGLLGGFGND